MKTRAELIREVLETLGALAVGQTPSSEDYNAIDNRIEPILNELRARRVIDIPDAEEFEDEVFLALADVVTGYSASAYVASQIRGMDMETFRLRAESRLRYISSGGHYDFVLRAEYF